jgi:hypothetical protein
MTSAQSQLNGLQLSFLPSSQHTPVVMDHAKTPVDAPSSIDNDTNFNSVSLFVPLYSSLVLYVTAMFSIPH